MDREKNKRMMMKSFEGSMGELTSKYGLEDK